MCYFWMYGLGWMVVRLWRLEMGLLISPTIPTPHFFKITALQLDGKASIIIDYSNGGGDEIRLVNSKKRIYLGRCVFSLFSVIYIDPIPADPHLHNPKPNPNLNPKHHNTSGSDWGPVGYAKIFCYFILMLSDTPRAGKETEGGRVFAAIDG